MRIVLKLFGLFPLITLDVISGSFEDEDECEETRIEGGSAHNFERDVNPVTPEDRYAWEWDDKRRGFGFS